MTKIWVDEVRGDKTAGTAKKAAADLTIDPDFNEPDPETGWSLADIARLQRMVEFLSTSISASKPLEWGASMKTDGLNRAIAGKSRVGIDRATDGGIAFSTVSGLDDFETLPRITHETPEKPTLCAPKYPEHHATCEKIVKLLHKLAEPTDYKGSMSTISYSPQSYLVCKKGESGMLANEIALSGSALQWLTKTINGMSEDAKYTLEAFASGEMDMAAYCRNEVFSKLAARKLTPEDRDALTALEYMIDNARAVGKQRSGNDFP